MRSVCSVNVDQMSGRHRLIAHFQGVNFITCIAVLRGFLRVTVSISTACWLSHVTVSECKSDYPPTAGACFLIWDPGIYVYNNGTELLKMRSGSR